MSNLVSDRHNTPKIEKHIRYHDFMRIFDEMRKKKGMVSYQELFKAISHIAPEINYFNVYNYFSRFQDNYLVKQNVKRMELREWKKRIAYKALSEVEEKPDKLPIWLRIRLGQEATNEELRELGMLLTEKHKQKEESFMERLLNKARYSNPDNEIEGEIINEKPFLDKRVEGLELPNPNAPDR